MNDNLHINNEAIEAVNEGRDVPAYVQDFENVRAFHIKYHSTDGWRGYYESTATKKSGWKKIDYEGWVTGEWDDAPENARCSTVDAKLNELAREYERKGYHVTAVFSPTSNVFSTAFDVFVKRYT